VFFEPKDLGCCETGQRIVTGDLDQTLLAHAGPDLVSLRATPLIVPQDRGTKNFSLMVEGHQSVHLAGQADRANVFTGNTSFGESAANTLARSLPP
jgi:hypothetical protein